MMKVLINSLCLLSTLFFSLLTFAQDNIDIHNEDYKYLGSIYQQSQYQLNDPFGDVLLLWTNSQIPKIILKSLKGEQAEIIQQRKEKIAELLKIYPQFAAKEETKNLVVENYVDVRTDDLPYELEGHKAPFRTKNLALMMKQVIAEEFNQSGIEPQIGNVHEWSPEISKKLKRKFPLLARFSKLLMALCRGSTANYMITGYEDELADYILSRPENSITLEEMFRISYRINKGDVYLTFLTIENILSRHWHTPRRSQRAITTKLKDITNFNYKTDKFGSWYHLFGIMLYGYAEGGFKSTIVGTVESWGSLLMGGFQDEKQENIINKRGGKVGNRLKHFIQKGEFKNFQLDSKYLEESFYLQLDEDFSKRLNKLQ